MNKDKSILSTVLKFFISNWVTLIISLVCAITIWGFIMMNENPDRTKTLREVPVTLDGEADLLTRHLVVVGDRKVILPDVSVKVNIDLLNYSELSSKDITAVASLRQVNGEGDYTLSINATSTKGKIVEVSPSTVTVNVDRLNTKKIPVEINTRNELSDGLAAGKITTSHSQIEIEGASSIISNVEKAVYILDLSEITESVNVSGSLTLIDTESKPLSQAEIYGEIPSVVIKMPIYYYKDVKFDIEGNIINKDQLHENYEITGINSDPSSVRLLSESKSDLDEIDAIDIEKIDLSSAKESILKTVKFTLPDNTWLENNLKNVTVWISIREKQIERTFDQVKVIVHGEHSNLDYKYDVTAVKVTIKCGISVANTLEREMIELYIDVADFDQKGEYAAPIMYKLKGVDTTDIIVKLSTDKVKIEIK